MQPNKIALRIEALRSEAGDELLSLFSTLDAFEKRALAAIFSRIAEIEKDEGGLAAEEALAQAIKLFVGERQ